MPEAAEDETVLRDSQERRADILPAGNLLELLAWVAARPRTYAQTMEAWRTSCPRLSVWEDATAEGLVRVRSGRSGRLDEAVVALTERGAALLAAAQTAGADPAQAASLRRLGSNQSILEDEVNPESR